MERDYFVDIHSHLFPGIDDGSCDLGMTLSMIHIAYDHGVRQLFFTPHSYYLTNNPDSIGTIFRQIESKMNHVFPEIRLFLGCEVFCDIKHMDVVLYNLSNGIFFSMNGTNYVLVEFSLWAKIESICNCVDQLLSHNWVPIISHAERYINLIDRPEMVRLLRKKGCFFQSNIYSFSEQNQSGNRNWARTLVAHQLVDFLGTDAHNAYFRPPDITLGMQWLENNCCQEYLEAVAWKNAKDILIK